jgi:MFS transporter, FHS family, L-fucose permease
MRFASSPAAVDTASPQAVAAPRLFVLNGRNLAAPFFLVSSLFLVWGFCNGMIDVMDKHFQEDLHLSLAQSAWIQFAHYLGYFLMALPAGALAQRLGYKGGIIAGLLLVAAGGLWFLAAVRIAAFWSFLLGVMVIASGLTFLETVSNPYSSLLGHPRYAAVRTNLAQSFNGVGWILGPIAGSLFFYSVDEQGRSTGSNLLYVPYVGVAVVVLLLALVFCFAPVPEVSQGERASRGDLDEASPADALHVSLWRQPHFVVGVIAQFVYVAAQAGVFAFFINYMTADAPAVPQSWAAALSAAARARPMLGGWLSGWLSSAPAGAFLISNKGAANLASVAFVLFLLGRISGAFLLRRFAAHQVLLVYALAAVVFGLLVVGKLGWLSVVCVFLLYFCMSIMFPTIFALGIHGLGSDTKRASAWLIMAIIGGALVPKVMGAIADRRGVSASFVVPIVCFALIAWYAVRWPRYIRVAR